MKPCRLFAGAALYDGELRRNAFDLWSFAMRRLLLTVTALVLATAPVSAVEPTEWVPNLVRDQVWFACGSSKVTPDNPAGNAAGWDREAPTQSVTAGAGCGTIDSPF